jgi:hypothetical protein
MIEKTDVLETKPEEAQPEWSALPWSKLTHEQRDQLTPVQREEAKLRDREQAVAKQRRRLASERAKESKKAEADQKRRDNLIGQVVQRFVAAHPKPYENGFSWPAWLHSQLNAALENPRDRALFDLPERGQ